MCEKEQAIHTLVEAGCYWIVNWRMVQELGGTDEALLLGYLCSMQKLYGNAKGVFYRTIPDMKRETLLDVRRQRTALRKLAELGLIEMRVTGMPKKRYFWVNAERVNEYLHHLSVSQQYGIYQTEQE